MEQFINELKGGSEYGEIVRVIPSCNSELIIAEIKVKNLITFNLYP